MKEDHATTCYRLAIFCFTILALASFHSLAVPLGQPVPTDSDSFQVNNSDNPGANTDIATDAGTATKESEAEKQTVTETNDSIDTPQTTETAEKTSEQNTEEAPDVPDKEKIVRAQFTTAIVDKEPADDVVMLTSNNNEIYFFTELSNLQGESVTHRWEFEGQTMAEIKLDIKGSPWRTFSSKKLKPEWTGLWSVIVIDEDGQPLNISSVEVVIESDAN